ncbi:capsular polysaccharide biosynthesis protein [Sphingomonas sp. UYAg733]
MVLKKNPLLLVIIGLVLLAAGAFMSLTGGPPQADSAMVTRCQDQVRDRGADQAPEMLEKCRDTAFAAAMTAADADSAARAISAANSREVGGNTLAMFLIGIGLALTIGGAVAVRKSRIQRDR